MRSKSYRTNQRWQRSENVLNSWQGFVKALTQSIVAKWCRWTR